MSRSIGLFRYCTNFSVPIPFSGRLTSAVFQGIAAGTFLHVAFCELIPGELNSHVPTERPQETDHQKPEPSFCDKRIFRVLLIFLGFVFMSFVTLFIDH